MINSCKQQQNFPSTHVSIAGWNVNGLRQLLMMNLYGTRNMATFQTNSLTVLNTLEMCDVQNVKKNGRAHKLDWRDNWAPEVARNLILRYPNEG